MYPDSAIPHVSYRSLLDKAARGEVVIDGAWAFKRAANELDRLNYELKTAKAEIEQLKTAQVDERMALAKAASELMHELGSEKNPTVCFDHNCISQIRRFALERIREQRKCTEQVEAEVNKWRNADPKHPAMVILVAEWEAVTHRAEQAEAALTKINDIRNSIVGSSTVNWSEHIYPLVAALNEAGLKGDHFENTKKNFGTLLERAEQAEADRDKERGEKEHLAKICNGGSKKYYDAIVECHKILENILQGDKEQSK